MHFDQRLALMGGILIVLRQLLANLARRCADDRVGIGVVVRCPAENINTQRTFLQLIGIASQGTFHNVPEQRLASMAVAE